MEPEAYLLVGLASVLLLFLWRLTLMLSGRRYAGDRALADEAVHAYLFDEVRGKRPRRQSVFLLEGSGYPMGYHRLATWIGISSITSSRVRWIVPTVIDSGTVLVIVVVLWALDLPPTYWLLALPFARVWTSTEARWVGYGERSLGTLIGVLYSVAAFELATNASMKWYAMLGALVLVILAIAVSKFAVQGVAVTSVAISAAFWTPLPLAVLVGSVLVAIVAPGGYLRSVLAGSLRHSTFYATYLSANFYGSHMNHHYSRFIQGWFGLRNPKILLSSPIYRIFSDLPTLALAVAFMIAGWDDVNPAFAVWIACIIGWILLTATPFMAFLGEPERYLEYVILPSFLVIALSTKLSVSIPMWIPTLVAIATVVACLSQIIQSRGDARNRRSAAALLDELTEALAGRSIGVVLTVPYKLAAPLALARPDAQFYCPVTNVGGAAQREEFKSMTWRYPFARADILELQAARRIDTLIVDREATASLTPYRVPREWHEVASSQRFVVWQRSGYADQ